MYGLRRGGGGHHWEVCRQVRQVLLHQVQLTDVPRLGQLGEPGLDVGDLLQTEISVLLPRPRPGWSCGSAAGGGRAGCGLPAPLGLRANLLAEQPQLGNLDGHGPAQDPHANLLPLPHFIVSSLCCQFLLFSDFLTLSLSLTSYHSDSWDASGHNSQISSLGAELPGSPHWALIGPRPPASANHSTAADILHLLGLPGATRVMLILIRSGNWNRSK